MKIIRYAALGTSAAVVDFLIFAVFAKLLGFQQQVSTIAQRTVDHQQLPMVVFDMLKHVYVKHGVDDIRCKSPWINH